MIILIFSIIATLIYICFKVFKHKKVLKNKTNISLNRNNLYRWMNLTKRERYNLSKKDSASYLNKRKVLLDQIRKEYKIISKEK